MIGTIRRIWGIQGWIPKSLFSMAELSIMNPFESSHDASWVLRLWVFRITIWHPRCHQMARHGFQPDISQCFSGARLRNFRICYVFLFSAQAVFGPKWNGNGPAHANLNSTRTECCCACFSFPSLLVNLGTQASYFPDVHVYMHIFSCVIDLLINRRLFTPLVFPIFQGPSKLV